MTMEFADGLTSAVFRLRSGGGWTPVHMTISCIELEPDTFAGLFALRLPTDEEVAAAELDDEDDVGAKAAKP
jgi:Rv3651-like, C-terminal domain